MGIKEKLYREYVEKQNKVNALNGSELITFNSEASFSLNASHYKKSEIIDLIRYAEAAYEEELERIRVENYFNTEEGKVEKDALNQQIDNVVNKKKDLFFNTTKEVDSFIKSWLGQEWGCGFVGATNVEIGLIDSVNQHGANNFHFGHTFTVYYGNSVFNTDRFDMNYGSMGSFNLLGDNGNLRCKFLVGMGLFVSDKNKLNELKSIVDEFCKTFDSYNKELFNLQNKLAHPFDTKRVA